MSSSAKVVPCPAAVMRKLAIFERASTVDVVKLTGALQASGLTLPMIAAEIGFGSRAISAWRSGENQAPDAAVRALRALLAERCPHHPLVQGFERPRLLAIGHAPSSLVGSACSEDPGLITGEQASRVRLADQKAGSNASDEDFDRNGVTDGESAARNAARPGVTPGETGQLPAAPGLVSDLPEAA